MLVTYDPNLFQGYPMDDSNDYFKGFQGLQMVSHEGPRGLQWSLIFTSKATIFP